MLVIFRQFRNTFRKAPRSQCLPALRTRAFGAYSLVGCWFVVGMLAAFAPGGAQSQQSSTPPQPQVIPVSQDIPPYPQNEPGGAPTQKRKQELLKFNFEKMKRDADDLAALAKSLQEEIERSNENVFSLKLVEKAEKIEKLAKRIKAAAKAS